MASIRPANMPRVYVQSPDGSYYELTVTDLSWSSDWGTGGSIVMSVSGLVDSRSVLRPEDRVFMPSYTVLPETVLPNTEPTYAEAYEMARLEQIGRAMSDEPTAFAHLLCGVCLTDNMATAKTCSKCGNALHGG